MNKALKLASALLEDNVPPGAEQAAAPDDPNAVPPVDEWEDVMTWPEFQGKPRHEVSRILFKMPFDRVGNQILCYGRIPGALGPKPYVIVHCSLLPTGLRFSSSADMEYVIDSMLESEYGVGVYAPPLDDRSAVDADHERHIYTWKSEPVNVPTYTLEQKMAHAVYEHGNYVFLKMPADHDFVRREGIEMRHPVSGDTKVVTYDGLVPIAELAGKKVKLLTRLNEGNQGFRHATWREATVSGFGVHPVLEVTLERHGLTKKVKATPTHRWYAFNNTKNKQYLRLIEKTTATLEVGNRIPVVYPRRIPFKSESAKGIALSPVGVMHGVVFGDGTAPSCNDNNSVRGTKTVLYGNKDAELRKWFPESSRERLFLRSVGGTEILDLPCFFKKLPDINESVPYLMGWLAGYVAADGNVDKVGVTGLHSAEVKNIDFVEALCVRLGIRYSRPNGSERVGYGKKRPIHRISFEVGALPADFYLLSAHRARVKTRAKAPDTWCVKSVVPCGESEVFCATVPETGVFVLDGNMLTGNCLSVAYVSYCERMAAGEIEVYSMTDKTTNKPVVDIEVALTRSSYGGPVKHPTVSQIRGVANQCPPKDEYLPDLVAFLTEYGKNWTLQAHQTRNFDSQFDGDLVMRRYTELTGK